jgi:adenylate kinase
VTLQVVLLGAPGSGKSTLCRRLLDDSPGLASFGVRRYFTDAIAAGTPFGLRAQGYARHSDWLPDELVADAVRHEFARGAFDHGVVFEGMPAKARQAELLDQILTDRGHALTAAIHVDAPDAVCLARAARRMVCYQCDHGSWQAVADPADPSMCASCGGPITRRPNDSAEAMRARLEEHRILVAPLLDYYGGRLIRLDATLSRDDVYQDLLRHLDLQPRAAASWSIRA